MTENLLRCSQILSPRSHEYSGTSFLFLSFAAGFLDVQETCPAELTGFVGNKDT